MNLCGVDRSVMSTSRQAPKARQKMGNTNLENSVVELNYIIDLIIALNKLILKVGLTHS